MGGWLCVLGEGRNNYRDGQTVITGTGGRMAAFVRTAANGRG